MFGLRNRLKNKNNSIKTLSRRWKPVLETLEDRTVPAVSILNGGGLGYAGINDGSDPPDTCGAAGPSSYIEAVNGTISIFSPKATGASTASHGIFDFFFNPAIGNRTKIDAGSRGVADSTIIFDNLMGGNGRFIIGEIDINATTNVSQFIYAVSTSNNPTTLTAADWRFYSVVTTEGPPGNTDWTDYPGNPGFNADAVVITFNMAQGNSLTGNTQIVSINANDLANGVAAPATFHNDIAGTIRYRPTTMHDAVSGDPMWLIRNPNDGTHVNVTSMTNILSNAAGFATTSLALPAGTTFNPGDVSPKNPDSSTINDIDTRILKAGEYNHTIVATNKVKVSANEADAQWYAIDVSGTPTFQLVGGVANVGRVGFGANTYAFDPGIDINSLGQIGLTFNESDTIGGAANATTGGFVSTFVTARQATDAAGTMQTSVLVPAGKGTGNITDRSGDFSGMNIDPVNGTFWAVNEVGNNGNGATAIANFTPILQLGNTDENITIRVKPGDSTTIQVLVTGTSTVVAMFTNNSTSTFFIVGDANSNAVTVDETFGNVNTPINFNGGGNGDSLHYLGAGADTGSYLPSTTTNGSGVVTADGQTFTFSNLTPVFVTAFATFTFTTPNSNDVLTVASPTLGHGLITGTSGGVGFESLDFSAIGTFTLAADTNGGSDSLTINSLQGATNFIANLGNGGDVATINGSGVATSLIVNGGSGNDTFTVTSSSAAAISINGGLGNNTIIGQPTGATFTVNGANSGQIAGGYSFQNIQNLMGQGGADTFNIVAGGSISGTINGGGGNDQFNVAPNASVPMFIDGGGSVGETNTATFDLAGVTNPVLTPTGPNSFLATFGNRAPVTLTNIQVVIAINGTFALGIVGTNLNDVVTISRSGANLVVTISTNGGPTTTIFNGPSTTFSSINVSLLAGNDQLIVDESGGVVTQLINCDGGPPAFPTVGGDSLLVRSGSFANLVYNATGIGAGTLTVDGNVISFTSLEPVTVASALGNATINLTDAAAHTTTIGDDGTANNNLSKVSIDGGIESLAFTNPTGTLAFNGNNNNNTVILNALDTASLIPTINIQGGSASDEIQIRTLLAGQSANVQTNGGTDHTVIGGSTLATFNTGSAAANLANVLGTVNVLSNSTSTVHVDDSGFAGGRVITSNNLPAVPFFGGTGVQISATGLSTQVNVVNGAHEVQTASGAGNDTFRVNTTLVASYGGTTIQSFFGNNGSDNFFVRPSVSAPIFVFGGAPQVGDPGVPPAGDRLVVNAYGATVSPLFSPDGQVTAPGLQPVVFNNIEFVTVPDRFEINDTPSQATFLGSDPTVSLMNLSIHSVDDPTTPSVNEADVDYFRYVAHDTGYLTINAQYLSVVGGQMVVEVYRPTSLANLSGPNVIGAPFNNPANYITSTPGAVGTIDGTTLNIPVVKGQVYYIKVRGNNQQLDAGNYNLEIENFAAAVPTVVNMPANLPGSPVGTNDNDTGRSNTDGITNNASPYFIVQDDLRDLANAGVAMLTGAQATAGQTAGAAVQVYVRTFGGVPITSFFADPVAGSNNTLWSIRTTALPDGNYQITASTVIFDNNSPNGLAAEVKRSGVTQLGSPPLNFTIDTVAPAPPSLFLNPPDDSGIPGQPGTYVDNITKYSAANFTGNSESNSWVQFYALDRTSTPQFDGTAPANAFGQYFIDPTFDLNNPAFFDQDGERNLLATATDVAGNQSTPQNLQIFLDTTGPRVAGVTYRYVDANGNIVIVNLLDQTVNGTKVVTPAINYIDVTLLDQPNRTNNFLYPAANELLATTPGNYGIVGKRTGAVTIASVIVLEDDTVAGSIGLTTYRLLLSKPLANDLYKFTIFDRIQDQAGNALDGDYQPPILPSGDGVPGDDFVAYFSTANSSASTKLGFFANGSINLDLNGDYIVNPGSTVGTDAVIPYAPNGSAVFSGQFYDPNVGTVDGFDRLGTYGKEGGKYVFRLDLNNDGDFSDPGEKIVQTALQINGMPIAGNWGPSAINLASGLLTGSNVGVFDGTTWYLDTNGNNIIESAAAGDRVLKGNMRGLPFTGDFDGDGKTDLGTYQNGVFYLDLTSHDSGGLLTGNTNYTFRATLPLATSGTASKLARPVSADFNGDGISDIGLFIPNQTTVPAGQASWFLMNSNGLPWDIAVPSGSTRAFKTASTGLGTDFAVTYGSARALPVVGNFDPSTRKSTTTATVPGLKQVLANVAHGLTDLYFSSTDSTDFVIGKLRKGKGR